MQRRTLLILLFVVILASIVVIMKCSTPKALPPVVNIRVIPLKLDLYTEQVLMFDVVLRTNVGVNVKILSDLYSDQKKETYFSLPDSFNFSKNLTKRYKIALPQKAGPGNYSLRVLLTYAEKKVLVNYSIRIKEAPKAPIMIVPKVEPKPEPAKNASVAPNATPAVKNNATHNISIREDNITKEPQKPLVPEPGMPIPQDLKRACITEERMDSCISDYAIQNNQSSICASVSDINVRDNCYITFIEDGDLSLCGKVVFPEFRDYCLALVESQDMTTPAESLPMDVLAEDLASIQGYAQGEPLYYSIEVIEGSVD